MSSCGAPDDAQRQEAAAAAGAQRRNLPTVERCMDRIVDVGLEAGGRPTTPCGTAGFTLWWTALSFLAALTDNQLAKFLPGGHPWRSTIYRIQNKRAVVCQKTMPLKRG